MAEKKKTGKKKSSSQLKVSDLIITDEFKTIKPSADGKSAAATLMEIPRGVVLVINKDGNPEGVITAREFLQSIVDGNNPTDMKASGLMNSDIMEIKYDSLLDKVVPEITKADPYAVVVTDKSGNFKGYFSPKDYQEALARINYVRPK